MNFDEAAQLQEKLFLGGVAFREDVETRTEFDTVASWNLSNTRVRLIIVPHNPFLNCPESRRDVIP